MARIIIDTTPAQDSAAQVVFQRDTFKDPALTIAQWAKQKLVDVLDGWVAQIEGERRMNRATLYKVATPEDQAAIDAILAKYQ